jgi:hypothetical protein
MKKKVAGGTLCCRFCGKELEFVCSKMTEHEAIAKLGWAEFTLASRDKTLSCVACVVCRKLLEGKPIRKKAVEVGNSACIVVGKDLLGKDVLAFVGETKK